MEISTVGEMRGMKREKEDESIQAMRYRHWIIRYAHESSPLNTA